MQIKEIHSVRYRSEKHLVNENEMIHHLIIKATISNDLTYLFVLEKDEEEKIVCLCHYEGFSEKKVFSQREFQEENKRHELTTEELIELQKAILLHPKVKIKALFLEETYFSKRRFKRLLDLGFALDKIFSRYD